jgi:hypothetical protein
VHVGHDLLWIEQNNKMLGQEGHGVHNQIVLRQPNGAILRNAEMRTDDAHMYVREFVWIVNLSARRVPMISGTAEQATLAVGWSVSNLASACAALPMS